MKNPLHSYLDLEMDIGWHHFAIGNIIESYNKSQSNKPIDKEIDKATGYGLIRDKETIESLLGHLTRLVRKHRKMKVVYNKDYSSDKEKQLIKDLKAVQKTLTPNQYDRTH